MSADTTTTSAGSTVTFSFNAADGCAAGAGGSAPKGEAPAAVATGFVGAPGASEETSAAAGLDAEAGTPAGAPPGGRVSWLLSHPLGSGFSVPTKKGAPCWMFGSHGTTATSAVKAALIRRSLCV